MRVPYYETIYTKKYRNGNSSNTFEDVDITSLLDILVILLFFLLLHYNPTDLEVNANQDVTPPVSESLDYGSLAVIVQVNKDQEVYFEIEKNPVGKINQPEDVSKIKNRLQSEFESQKKRFSQKKGELAQNFKNINFILDQELTYSQMEKLMVWSSKVGFENFKFIVKAKIRDSAGSGT